MSVGNPARLAREFHTRPGKYGGRAQATLLVLMLAACTDTPPSSPPGVPDVTLSFAQLPRAGASLRGHNAVGAAEREAARDLARAVAAALADEAAVDYVKTALASSAAREHKLHFASFLSGRGGPFLSAILRNGAITLPQLTAAIRSVRDLEFYMPVPAHRDQWTGTEAPLVATALREEEAPEGYDRDGRRHALNRVYPPARPVLMLAPTETDLRSQIELNVRGRPERACTPLRAESITEAAARCGAGALSDRRPSFNQIPAEIVGLYVTAIEHAGDECGGECWGWGNPEYQIYTFARTATSGSQMRVIQCSGDDALPDYRWNMDGRSWAGQGLLLTRAQMVDAVQRDSGWMHQFWEDDQDNCDLVPYVDPWAEALAVIAAVRDAWIALQDTSGGLWGPAVARAIRAAADGIQGLIMGGDDLIGNMVHRDASQFGSGGGTHNMVIQRGTNGNVFVGRATIRAYTASGPYVGPVVTVKISHADGTKVPVGSVRYLSAYGVDEYGTPVPNRPVSWSSSNPAAVSVDQSGAVTGHSVGSATITATIDGRSASAVIYAEHIGEPVRVDIQPSALDLDVGGSAQLTAVLYDTNGWEVPPSGVYMWSTSVQGPCSTNGASHVTQVVANSTPGAYITVNWEGLTDTIWCSVGGGDEHNVAPAGPVDQIRPTPSAPPGRSKPGRGAKSAASSR